MSRPARLLAASAAVVAPLAITPAASALSAAPAISHVLYISVDGLHESDLQQYVSANPTSTLAQLVAGGTTYANASTSEPSDSFPGTVAALAGATPKSSGVYYDVTYDRTLYAPGSNCAGSPGSPTAFDETIDTNAGSDGADPSTATPSRTILGESIDPTQLPEQLVGGTCSPVYPSDFLADNTVFSVAAAHGLYTAYSDKHPAYELVEGHGTPNAINDLYTPEINADIIPPTLTVSRGATTDTVSFPLNSSTSSSAAITNSLADTESYDQLKVDATLNQIDGLRSNGAATTPNAGTVPSIFGMNFQSVSVGEKLADPAQGCARTGSTITCNPGYQPGGYEPGTLTFTPQMEDAVSFVNSSLTSIVDELNAKGLASSTELILSAKHGQSPIDPSTLNLAGDILPSYVGTGASVVMDTSDDIGLLWLAKPSEAPSAASSIIAGKGADFEATVYQGGSGPLAAGAQSTVPIWGDPATSALQAARQPDLIVQPQHGVIYSHSSKKVAEHGGLSSDDTHVALVVDAGVPALSSTPSTGGGVPGAGGPGTVVTNPVQTTQIAPTILRALGLDPAELTAVQQEGTQVLPTTDAPTPALPEAPAPALLLGLGGVVAAAAVALSRRRAARRA